MRMLKSKRRKELELKERELFILKQKIDEVKHWCASDSPEIGFCMMYLQSINNLPESVDRFRNKLRNGLFTFDGFKLAQKISRSVPMKETDE